MNKKESKSKKFFEEFWYETEPLIKELFTFTVVIIAFWFVGYITESFIKAELKDNISIIKTFFLISALSFCVFHTLIKMLIRFRKSIFKELKDEENDEDIEDEVDKEAENNKPGKNEQNKLSAKSMDFDDADELQNSEKNESKKVRIVRDK
jgi:hypothetical protein